MKSITSFTNLDAGGQHFWQERVVKITSYTIKLNILYNLWFHPLSNWSGIFLYSAASHEDICGRKLGRGMSDLVKSVWNFSVPFDTQSQGWIYWEVWLAGGWLCNFMQTHSEPPKMEQNWEKIYVLLSNKLLKFNTCSFNFCPVLVAILCSLHRGDPRILPMGVLKASICACARREISRQRPPQRLPHLRARKQYAPPSSQCLLYGNLLSSDWWALWTS